MIQNKLCNELKVRESNLAIADIINILQDDIQRRLSFDDLVSMLLACRFYNQCR